MGKKEKELTLEEAKEMLIIDKHSLDKECEQHPSLYDEIAEMHVTAISIRDNLKEKMDKTWAERAQYYRTHATEKVTEGKIQELVAIDNLYTKAQKEYAEAKLEADLWGVRRDAFGQRAGMIRSLSDLYTAGYFNLISVQSTKPKQASYHQNREKIVQGKVGKDQE